MPAPKYTRWITPEGREKIRRWVADGLTDGEIAEKMGTSPSRLSTWRREHKEIREALIRPEKADDGTIRDKHERYTGKPARKLTAVEKVKSLVEEWEEECRKQERPLTVPSLCLKLGISKDTLISYLHEGEQSPQIPVEDSITGNITFLSVSDVLKRAYLMIENDLINRSLTTNNPGGAIFALKNWYGYADKKEVNVNNTSVARITSNEIDERLKALLDKARE